MYAKRNPANAGFFVFGVSDVEDQKERKMTVRHFLTTQDVSRSEIDALLEQAAAFKRSPAGRQLAGRSVALLFFNSSMRTRTSFEVGVFELGGQAVHMEPGKGRWPHEFAAGTGVYGAADAQLHACARVLK